MLVTWPAINRALAAAATIHPVPPHYFSPQALRQGGCQWLPASAR
ncbi:unnamed protein product [Ectocarpus fasciculatus]